MATDKRWHRRSAASAQEEKSFHGIGGAQRREPMVRKRSDSLPRNESWMAKVTTAMSHRIFAGRKLSGSRSTQVMPVGVVDEPSPQKSDSAAGNLSSRDLASALRHTSSEQTLSRSVADVQSPRTPANSERCEEFVCDIALDVDDSEQRRSRDGSFERESSSSESRRPWQSISVRAPAAKKPAEKVAPRRKMSLRDDGDSSSDEDNRKPARTERRQSTAARRLSTSSDPRNTLPIDAADDAPIQDAAPILKDFFSRSTTSGQRLRAQQRDKQREHVYKRTKERQDKLRRQAEAESQQTEAHLRKLKVEQLRKANIERRRQLLEEAAQAREHLSSATEQEKDKFEQERAKWEDDFQEEIGRLSQAYRKARGNRIYDSDDTGARPMTVAGLVAPEAVSQLQREASNYEKRVKTAAPAGWRSLPEDDPASQLQFRARLPSRTQTGSITNILRVEDSEEIYETFECSLDRTSLVEELLEEREKLLQRIEQLERIVEQQRQGQASTGPSESLPMRQEPADSASTGGVTQH